MRVLHTLVSISLVLPAVTEIKWESPLQVLKYPDPRLRAVNAKIGTFDENLQKLAKEMLDIMYEDDGVGLAAPQVRFSRCYITELEATKNSKFRLSNHPPLLESGLCRSA